MTDATVQWVAAVMAAVNVATWIVWSRWERSGYGVELEARVEPLPLLGRLGDVIQVAPVVYPVLVVIVPALAQEAWWNWSTGVDAALRAVGLALWGSGVAVGLWAARAIGGYGAFGGVTADHHLVSDGPYRHVRHPIYTALMAIAVGTTLVFRSYLLLVVAALSVYAHVWWAVAEEELLTSSQGLGDDYGTYMSETGRFLPRVRRHTR